MTCMGSSVGVPAHSWTDDDGVVLGDWVTIERDEYLRIMGDHGGLQMLTVFSTLTDPDGVYGSPQVYTAWGRKHDRLPLIDCRDEVARGTFEPLLRTYRKFVAREAR